MRSAARQPPQTRTQPEGRFASYLTKSPRNCGGHRHSPDSCARRCTRSRRHYHKTRNTLGSPGKTCRLASTVLRVSARPSSARRTIYSAWHVPPPSGVKLNAKARSATFRTLRQTEFGRLGRAPEKARKGGGSGPTLPEAALRLEYVVAGARRPEGRMGSADGVDPPTT